MFKMNRGNRKDSNTTGQRERIKERITSEFVAGCGLNFFLIRVFSSWCAYAA
jgi:hypothetical protein